VLGKKNELVKKANIKSVVASALGVGRKNIYRKSVKEEKDLLLKADIEKAWEKHPAYGHLRLGWHLKVNHKRISRVMKKFGMKPPRRKVKWSCTVSSPGEIYFNLIKDWSPTKPNELWCADVSYVKFQDRFWYISTIEDIFTRRVLAVQVSKRHDSYLIFKSIKQAVINAKTFPKIFHTDQGMEYMAKLVTNYLEENSVDISVSDKGSPWQNGFQESLFGRFKDESGDLNRFDTTGEFMEAIYGQVHYYNDERIHTALRMPPSIYAKQLMQTGLQEWGT